jgi:hypothetical protein
MTMSLYAATVPSFQQILGSVSGLLAKGEAYCREKGLSPDELIQARLAPDMFPFAYQVKSACVHSLGAIEGVRKGQFSPDMTPPPATFAALAERVTSTLAALETVTPAELDALAGRDVTFVLPKMTIPFVASDFLLSFSLPNFFFHATTAYGVLRMKGVPVGKLDFLGRMRVKG